MKSEAWAEVEQARDRTAAAIRADLAAGDAGYRAAGEKFLKKKEGLPHGAWVPWLEANGFHKRQAQRLMEFAKSDAGVAFGDINHPEPEPSVDKGLRGGVVRELMLQMIDAGFKVVSKNTHPDKGGSGATQAELSAARVELRKVVRALEARNK